MTARIVLALVMFLIAGGVLTWLAIGPVKGQHAAPRGWADPGELTPLPVRVIPRAAVDGHPPWDDQPPPEAIIIAAGTVRGGQVHLERVAVLPPVVQKELGHATVDDWLASAYTRAMAMQVRQLTDGAP